MHTVAGMAPRPGTWRDELKAVLEGVLPTGRLAERTGAPTEADAMRQAIVSCLRQGLAAGLTVDADGEVAGRVAIPTGSTPPPISTPLRTATAPGSPPPASGAPTTSSVWGDDPATTCAFVLKDLTGDQRLWQSVR